MPIVQLLVQRPAGVSRSDRLHSGGFRERVTPYVGPVNHTEDVMHLLRRVTSIGGATVAAVTPSKAGLRVASANAMRCAALILLVGALLIGGTASGSAKPAQTTVHSDSMVLMAAQGCNGDVCMFLSTPSAGKVYVQAWAYNQTFTGHFQLTGPNGLSRNSTVGEWIGGKVNYYTFSNIPATVGKYCVTGWTTKLQNIGRPCESIL